MQSIDERPILNKYQSHSFVQGFLLRGYEMENLVAEIKADQKKIDRELVASFVLRKGFSTGHGESIEDLLTELEWQLDELRRTK